jgi:hypothetical protein
LKKNKTLQKIKPIWISEFTGNVIKIELIKDNIIAIGIKKQDLIGEIYIYEKINFKK